MTLFVLAYALLIGLVIGSFLNCLVWRLYKEEKVSGRSYCPRCRHLIAWYDNIPVFSFLFLRGRCRNCHKKISWQYPLVELITGILFLLAFWQQLGFSIPTDSVLFDLLLSPVFYISLSLKWLIIAVMVAVFIYDCRWYLVSTSLALFGAAFALILNLLLAWIDCGFSQSCFSWTQAILSPLLAVAFFTAQYLITKKRGLGEGDIWLGGMIGFMFPRLSDLALVLFLSYMIGAVTGLTLLALKKKQLGSKLPLGIFLSSGAIIALLFGDKIIGWYLGML
jgi:prepilin signal peptidase PulO-like enzyme (type II secretory pathway)